MSENPMIPDQRVLQAIAKVTPEDFPYEFACVVGCGFEIHARLHHERRYNNIKSEDRKEAVAQLERWEKALQRTLTSIKAVDYLATNAIAEAITGDSFIIPAQPLAYPNSDIVGRLIKVNSWEKTQAEQLETVQKAKRLLQQAGPPGGRPKEEYVLSLARDCVRFYELYNEPAKIPTWDPVRDKATGEFHDFLDEIFKATDIKLTARGFAKQAIEAQRAAQKIKPPEIKFG